ncbi:hypothetical protein Tco_0327442 [Tanacetum coccineum]
MDEKGPFIDVLPGVKNLYLLANIKQPSSAGGSSAGTNFELEFVRAKRQVNTPVKEQVKTSSSQCVQRTSPDDEPTETDNPKTIDDEEEIQDDEFVHTPEDYVSNDDESNEVTEEEYERINEELYVMSMNLYQETTLFETMTKSKSFNKSTKQRALYHALMESILKDEDAKSAESSKGTSKSQPKSTGKSTQAEETMFEVGDAQGPQNLREDTGNTDEPPVVNVDPKD